MFLISFFIFCSLTMAQETTAQLSAPQQPESQQQQVQPQPQEQPAQPQTQPNQPPQKSQIPRATQDIKVSDKDNPGIIAIEKVVNYCYDVKDLKNDQESGYINNQEYEKQKKELYAKFSALFDFYDVCEKSLKYDPDVKGHFRKDHWRGKTETQKQEFVKTFKELIEVIAYPLCNEFFGKFKTTHEVADDSTDKIIHIKSKTLLRKKYILSDWYFHKIGGEWKMYDLAIEGEDWIASFRSQFSEVIEKKSYEQLVKLLKDKKADFEAGRLTGEDVKPGKSEGKGKQKQNNKD